MRRRIVQFVFLACFAGPVAPVARGQAQPPFAPPPAQPATSSWTQVDGIAARIEDDVLTESELRELGAFQQVVDGQAKSREERIRELTDQWAVRNEASVARFLRPSAADVEEAVAEFKKQFASPEEFRARCEKAGLTETAIRRIVGEQLYLSRFLDYRFRPAAQVDQAQVEDYYHNKLAPELKARGQPVPPLEEVDDEIREVLIQRAVNERASKWLDETRDRLKVDIIAGGGG